VEFNYSNKFNNLISDKNKVREVLEGSFFHSDDFRKWENARSFIAKAIHKDGTILDIGCANGFLLMCLQEWSGYKLNPYGIDISKRNIGMVRDLFHRIPNHFASFSVTNIAFPFLGRLIWKHSLKLPQKFDFIYWNVWDNWTFEKPNQVAPVSSLLNMLNVGGRLILGFYDEKRENNLSRIETLKTKGYGLNRILENPEGNEVISWINNEKSS